MQKQRRIFLEAEWRNLLIANFECDKKLLLKYLPAKTEFDDLHGKTIISLVAFQFLNTKVLGIKFPFHVNFTEVNLRFYVNHKQAGVWKRGVVFIKEIVPKFMITTIANNLFSENYVTMKTSCDSVITNEKISLRYTWGNDNFFSGEAAANKMEIEENSIAEFITEHYWGYARINDETTMQYAVEHPRWKQYLLSEYKIACNFQDIYGPEFSYLGDVSPCSVLLAEGSSIIVRSGIKI